MRKYSSKSLDFPYTGVITYITHGFSFSCMFGDSAGICQNIEFLDIFTPTSWMPSQRKAQKDIPNIIFRGGHFDPKGRVSMPLVTLFYACVHYQEIHHQ